jgi:large subunit ribosomal protein L36e
MTTRTRQAPKAQRTANGIIAGLNRGFQTTKRPRKVQRNSRNGVAHKRLRAVKAIVADVVGLTPMEKRLVEMLRVGKEKRALKLAKKRLGNMTAAKKKRSRMEDYIRSTVAKKK